MLWLLLLLQVLASCLWLGHSEVVGSFNRCPRFFYANTPPNSALNPNNPAWICQRYHNAYRFATLYDRERRIPVYSAYIYKPKDGGRPEEDWFLEPMLIGKNHYKDMEIEYDLIHIRKFTLDQIKNSQAVLDDYRDAIGYDRGHLSPNGHHDGEYSRTATFTLTNIVPQNWNLNQGQWADYETNTMKDKNVGCTTTYVITGAVPGDKYIANGRVNVPSHIWSAACCLVDGKPTRTWAAIAENNRDEVEVLTLVQLENRLKALYEARRDVTLFHNDCRGEQASYP